VERLINECEKHIERNGKIYKCGNVYIAGFNFYPLIDMSYGGFVPYLIMDEYGNFIASNIPDKMVLVRNLRNDALFEDEDKNFDKNKVKNIIHLKNENCKIKKINFSNEL
jgi:hypothetical protein